MALPRTPIAALLALTLAGCTVTSTGDDAAANRASAHTQGVTGTSITLGVAATDPQQLKVLGIPSEGPSSEALFRAWAVAQNKAGGIEGRDVRIEFRAFLPTGPAEAQAACTELTSDKQVFAAIGILTGDTPLCFTETHKIPYIGLWGQSAERDKRSVAPFLAIEMADDRQRQAAVQALVDKGLFTGKKVALYWEAQDAAVTKAVVEPLLAGSGVKVVAKAGLTDFGTDQAAADQARDTIVQKFRASGADTVLNASNFSGLLVAFQRAGWVPRVVSTSAQGLSPTVMATTGITPATMRSVTIAAPYYPPKPDLVADPEVRRCVKEYDVSAPDATIDLATISRETLNSIANACAAFRLFALAAAAAGKDLTSESFGKGAESLGSVTLPGMPLGSVGPGKHSVGDAVGVYTFDAATGQMAPTGRPIPAK